MADAVNAGQRNLYPRKDGSRYSLDYMDGAGLNYSGQQFKLSWGVSTDVPAIGQTSSMSKLPEVKAVQGLKDGQQLLHPTTYTKYRHTDHLSFSKSMGDMGVGVLGNPKLKVHERLYLGTRSAARTMKRNATGRFEMAADLAFKEGSAIDAVALYTKAVREAPAGAPNLFAFEKRCAANAELGRYREALADAEYILRYTEGQDRAKEGAARMRVKTIKDYMRRMNNFENGYHQATSTLVCLLRPREHRQLVQSNPSTYSRPKSAQSFGKGLTSSHTMAALMGWDKDGDGNIDMDEFRQGVATLGYNAHKRERNVFKGSGSRGMI